MKRPLVCHFSGIYAAEDFCSGENSKNFEHLDCTQIHGTDGYLDDEAKVQIQKLFAERELEKIHFIDSGNFHYLSKLWTDRIAEPFNLLVFDHHSDMQRPAFDGVLSCGSWVRAVLCENPRVQKVLLVGVKEELIREIGKDFSSKAQFVSEGKAASEAFDASAVLSVLPENFPIYISIDKDALPEETLQTNWDGGSLSFPKLLQIVQSVCESRSVIGIDICGEPPESDTFQNPKNVERSSLINAELSKLQFATAKQTSPAKIPDNARNFHLDFFS